MLAKDAAIRSIKDILLMFYFTIRKPFQMISKLGLFKTILAFLVASFLLFNVVIMPIADSLFLHDDQRVIYLNILEPPQYAKNVSYLCEFKVDSPDTSILSYNQSYDGRTIMISTGAGDFKEKHCKKYFPGYLFNDYKVKGTIINVFYTENMNTRFEGSGDRQEMTITSDRPMRIFIRNKNAVLLQQSEHAATLVKGIAKLDHSVKGAFSHYSDYLSYSRHITFKDGERTIHHPKVYAYELPYLNQRDVSSHAEFNKDNKFSVDLTLPQNKEGEHIKAFFKIEGKVAKKSSWLQGHSPFNNFHLAAYDYIDTNELAYFNKAWSYGSPFVYALVSLFLMFFLINLYSIKNGVKLTSTTYGRPHLDDVIRKSSRPVMFGFGHKNKHN